MHLNAHYGSTSRAVHGRLMRVQAQRQKREAINGAADNDAWTLNFVEQSMMGVVYPAARRLKAAWPGPAKVEAAKVEAAKVEAPEIKEKVSSYG
jgi:hypothetical protein